MDIGKPVGGLEMKTRVGLATNTAHPYIQHVDARAVNGYREPHRALGGEGFFNCHLDGLVRENGKQVVQVAEEE